MLELKKLITAFIIPPGGFIVLLLLLAFWLWRRRLRSIASSILAVALLLWLASTTPFSQALMARLEADYTVPPKAQGDVIILLGGGIHQGVPDLTGTGAPSEDMLARMVTAVRLHQKLKIPILVSGGSVYAGSSPEAPVIKRFLVDLGVRDNAVLIESQSRDTMENAQYCQKLLRYHGFRAPLLVTSAYHMRRSIQSFQRAGVAVSPFPAQFLALGAPPAIWVDFLPSSGGLMRTSTAMKEFIGIVFNRLTQ